MSYIINSPASILANASAATLALNNTSFATPWTLYHDTDGNYKIGTSTKRFTYTPNGLNTIITNATTSFGLYVMADGDTIGRWQVRGDGEHFFGNGTTTDTTFYRSTTSTMVIGDGTGVAANGLLNAGTISLTTLKDLAGASTICTLGTNLVNYATATKLNWSDVYMYRSGAGSVNFDQNGSGTGAVNISLNTGTLTGNVSAPSSVTSPLITQTGALASTTVYSAKVSGDTNARYLATADGSLTWGAGGISTIDLRLYRSSASNFTMDNGSGGSATLSVNAVGTSSVTASTSITTPSITTAAGNLSISAAGTSINFNSKNLTSVGSISAGAITGTSFSATGAATSTAIITTNVSGDTTNRFQETADGSLEWGPGGLTALDTKFARTAAATVAISDAGGTIANGIIQTGKVYGNSWYNQQTNSSIFTLDGTDNLSYLMPSSSTFTVGGTGSTGNITIGQYTGAVGQSILVGSTGASTITLLGGNTANSQTFNLWNGNPSLGTQILNIFTGTATGGTQTINISTGSGGTKTVNIGTGTGTNTIGIGNTTGSTTTISASSVLTLNPGTGSVLITGSRPLGWNGGDVLLQRNNPASLIITDSGGLVANGKLGVGAVYATSWFDLGSSATIFTTGTNLFNFISTVKLNWNSDTYIFRSAGGVIQISDGTFGAATGSLAIGNVSVTAASSGTIAYSCVISGQTAAGWVMGGDGAQYFGPGGVSARDVKFSRTAIATLAISDTGGNVAAGKLALGSLYSNTSYNQQTSNAIYSYDASDNVSFAMPTTSTMTIGAAGSSGAINIGTLATAGQTINIGNTGAASGVNFMAGNTANTQTVSFWSGAPSLGTQTFSLFTGTATGGTQVVNIMTGSGGTKNINIGTGTGTNTIGIGNITGSTTTISAGTAGLLLSTADTGTITLGTTSMTGTITLGQYTGIAGQTIAIGSTGASTTTIFGGNTAQTQTFNLWNGNPSAGTQTLNILTGTATGGTQAVNIMTGSGGTKTVSIGTGTGTNTIGIGNTTGSTTTVSAGTAGLLLSTADAGTITLGTSTMTGNIILGQYTGGVGQNIYIGGSGSGTVTVFNGNNLATQTMNIMASAATGIYNINMLSANTSSSTETVNIATGDNGSGTTTVNINTSVVGTKATNIGNLNAPNKTIQTLTSAGAVNTSGLSFIDTTSGSVAVTLADGNSGDTKEIRLLRVWGATAIVATNKGTFLMSGYRPFLNLIFTSSGWINLDINSNKYATTQQTKLVGSSNIGASLQGRGISLSADGNTLAVGAPGDNTNVGAVWVFTRSGTTWTQQQKIIVSGSVGAANVGTSVSLSADGNTLAIGGPNDNTNVGGVWIYTRSGGVWSIQGSKQTPANATGSPKLGFSVALSADGNTLVAGGPANNTNVGAVWIFTRSGTTWTANTSPFIGPNVTGAAQMGTSVCISADGSCFAFGGPNDNTNQGAIWILYKSAGSVAGYAYAYSSSSSAKYVPLNNQIATNGTLGWAISMSADGRTILAGAPTSANGAGAVFKSDGGLWTQTTVLDPTDNTGVASMGYSVHLSADGNLAYLGGWQDATNTGAAWIFANMGHSWQQVGTKLVGTGATGAAQQGVGIYSSSDGSTLAVGGYADNTSVGATWIFD